jgi:hypothetical protein
MVTNRNNAVGTKNSHRATEPQRIRENLAVEKYVHISSPCLGASVAKTISEFACSVLEKDPEESYAKAC